MPGFTNAAPLSRGWTVTRRTCGKQGATAASSAITYTAYGLAAMSFVVLLRPA